MENPGFIFNLIF